MKQATRFKVLQCCFLLVIGGCLLLAQASMAEEGINGNLVSVNWLEKNLKNPDVLVLDTSSTQVYNEQHIPGAVNADIFVYGIREIPIAEMERLFQSWGISPGKKIVMYDQGGGMMATKLFHSLDYYGFPTTNLLVLDGGLSKWQETKLPVTKESTPNPNSGSFKITNLNEDVRAKLPEVLTATGDPEKSVLVEALGADWHFGEVAPFDRPGHIPRGILLPSTDFYNSDKTFKSAEEIKKMLTYMGISPQQQIYTYCGGGVAASVPFFALKFIADYPKVKLYKESEMGWLSDERRLPYWTYDAPFLMRQSNWLQVGASQRIRMYGGSQISIVDLRSAPEFSQGHVPFALNIPADVFKRNIRNPRKLAEILGPAGVNASDEAVVISGAGLTKDSALAFVMLQKLGQKKVSIFLDTMNQWANAGLAISKDTTVVGPKTAPYDVSIVPTTYPESFRKDVVIAQAENTHGVYPKVFIAAGQNVSSVVSGGKVVHLQYTDLLNTDGTPKAAKDIWTILSKAGVPRYAELVCFSDDPGEAAVDYFILKLMGYPDVKMLVI